MWKLSLNRGIITLLSSALALVSVPCNAQDAPTSKLWGTLAVNNSANAVGIGQPAPASPPRVRTAPSKTGFFSTPIKRRHSGIPVIEVTFNGRHKFEMFLDTGASHTVITKGMAEKLAVPVVATTRFRTANGIAKLSIGMVKSIQVGSGSRKNQLVGIAPPDLPIGLLGQDFYGNYDITIKKNVIEFRRR